MNGVIGRYFRRIAIRSHPEVLECISSWHLVYQFSMDIRVFGYESRPCPYSFNLPPLTTSPKSNSLTVN